VEAIFAFKNQSLNHQNTCRHQLTKRLQINWRAILHRHDEWNYKPT